MKNSKRQQWGLVFLIAVQVAVLLLFFASKKGYFIDEIYSWGLSNSYYKPFVVSYDVFERWVEGPEFLEYMTVGPGEGFSYGSVWYNQAQDVHPPFFYMLLHTVCSFTPGVYGNWQAMVLNVAFYAGCLLMIFLTARLLTGDKCLAMAAMMLWGFSPGGLSTGIYIRMYMLATFLTVVSVYLHVKMIRDGQGLPRLAGICLATFLGLLTQYYFVFIAFFLSGFYVLWKLGKRRWKEAAVYAVALFASVGAMACAFPACIAQLTRTDEFVAAETRNNLAGGGIVRNLISYISNINMDFFGGWIRETAVAALAVGGYCLWRLWKRKKAKVALRPEDEAALILTLAVGFSFFAVSWIAVVPGARYIYNLYPLMVILAIWWVVRITGWCIENPKELLGLHLGMAAFMAVLYIGGYMRGNVQYLYPENEERTELAAQYRDLDCIYIDNYENAPLTQDLIELSGFSGVYIMPKERIGQIREILEGRPRGKGLIVYVDTNEFWSSGYDAREIMEHLQEETGFENCHRLYSHELSETYLLE